MFRFVIAALAASLTIAASATRADDIIATYYVELGPQDFYNSSGTRLRDGAAIFQQDRANYHRFGIRHGGDSRDPIFSDRALRAQIPNLFARGPSGGWLREIAGYDPNTAARPGFADYLVMVCGRGGQITYMQLAYADGDGYPDC